MRTAAYKLLPYSFILGLFVSVSSLLWLAIYYTGAPAEALRLMGLAGACIAVQVAAYLGGRRFKRARFWPGACMLASAPAVLWSGFAGPGALYGVDATLLETALREELPPMYYIVIPVMLGAILGCVVWGLVALISLTGDILSLAEPRDVSPARKAKAMRPAAAALPQNVPASGDTLVAPALNAGRKAARPRVAAGAELAATAEFPIVAAKPAAAESAAAKPAAAERPDTAAVANGPAPAALAEQGQPAPEAAGFVAARPEPTAAKAEPAATKPEPTAAKAEPAAAKAELAATKPEPAATKPEPAAAKPEPAAAKAEPAAARPEPAALKAAPPAAITQPIAAIEPALATAVAAPAAVEESSVGMPAEPPPPATENPAKKTGKGLLKKFPGLAALGARRGKRAAAQALATAGTALEPAAPALASTGCSSAPAPGLPLPLPAPQVAVIQAASPQAAALPPPAPAPASTGCSSAPAPGLPLPLPAPQAEPDAPAGHRLPLSAELPADF